MTELSADERHAIRAFLQRGEVRLSTLHRVATALLSGAGLMVLLPAIARDSVASVVRTLLETEASADHLLLVLTTVTVLLLPFVALWFVLRDLTRFYFHAQHLRHHDSEVFTPRFTLTGLRLPADELGPDATAALGQARLDPATVELLVPPKDATRRRIDRQLDAYGGLGRDEVAGDAGRARGLFALVASRERSLVEEAAKVEHGMARHLLRLQVIVLRYVKALLAFLATALAVFSAAAVVESDPAVSATAEIWLGAIFATWAAGTVVVVGSPVRWIDELLRSEGATANAVTADPELTRVEQVTSWMASLGWCLTATVLGIVLAREDLTGRQVAGVMVTLAITGGALVAALVTRNRRAPGSARLPSAAP